MKVFDLALSPVVPHLRSASSPRFAHSSRGFTIIELMTVVVLVGVLLALAVPSMSGFLQRRAVVAASEQFVSDMRLARSEAIKRAASVTVCRSENGSSCAGTGGNWNTGWIVFVNFNSNGVRDTDDILIRAQQSLPSIAMIAAPDESFINTRHTLTYRAAGRGRGMDQSLEFRPTGTVAQGSTVLVCISAQGRASVRESGATSCG